jgi:MatE
LNVKSEIFVSFNFSSIAKRQRTSLCPVFTTQLGYATQKITMMMMILQSNNATTSRRKSLLNLLVLLLVLSFWSQENDHIVSVDAAFSQQSAVTTLPPRNTYYHTPSFTTARRCHTLLVRPPLSFNHCSFLRQQRQRSVVVWAAAAMTESSTDDDNAESNNAHSDMTTKSSHPPIVTTAVQQQEASIKNDNDNDDDVSVTSTIANSTTNTTTSTSTVIIDYQWTKQTFAIALPALIGMLADPLLSLMDTGYVGRLGKTPLAALGPCTSIFHLAFNAFRATTAATTSLVATSLNKSINGNSTNDEARQVTAISLQLGLTIGMCVLITLLFTGRLALAAMGVGVTSTMYPAACAYLFTRLWAAPAVLWIGVAEGAFRGYGNTMTPLIASLTACVINLVLDPIFIFRHSPVASRSRRLLCASTCETRHAASFAAQEEEFIIINCSKS